MTKLPLLMALLATSASAQMATYKGVDFSIGARAGMLLHRGTGDGQFNSPSYTGFFRNDTQRVVLGPTFEVGFRKRWAVEFSPTWRRGGTTNFSDSGTAIPSEFPVRDLVSRGQYFEHRRNIWDFPLVGKFYLTQPDARWRPFVGAGALISRSSSQFQSYQRLESIAGERRLSAFQSHGSRWDQAPVAAAGVAFRSGRFSIVPEFRYVYDGRGQYPGPRNRVEFFLGFRF